MRYTGQRPNLHFQSQSRPWRLKPRPLVLVGLMVSLCQRMPGQRGKDKGSITAVACNEGLPDSQFPDPVICAWLSFIGECPVGTVSGVSVVNPDSLAIHRVE